MFCVSGFLCLHIVEFFNISWQILAYFLHIVYFFAYFSYVQQPLGQLQGQGPDLQGQAVLGRSRLWTAAGHATAHSVTN